MIADQNTLLIIDSQAHDSPVEFLLIDCVAVQEYRGGQQNYKNRDNKKLKKQY